MPNSMLQIMTLMGTLLGVMEKLRPLFTRLKREGSKCLLERLITFLKEEEKKLLLLYYYWWWC